MFGSCLSPQDMYLPQAFVSTKTIHKNIAVGHCPGKIILDVSPCVAELFADLKSSVQHFRQVVCLFNKSSQVLRT